jgi:dipeptidyl aminopeptidase/acylaminoacyl peptidase
LLATRGYAVLLPDSPQHVGTSMLDLAKSVLAGVNRVVDMGIADSARLGVMGQSNGGYSTLSLIVQTKRFKAALEMDGPGNLVGLYGAMDSQGAAFGTALERVFDAMGGTPWEFRDRYIENSPVFYLDRIETPLLVVHGENDNYVPSFLAAEVFVGLRRLGRQVEYARYQGSGHDPAVWSYPNQLDLCNRMIAWFNQYLKPDSLDHGAAPAPVTRPE